MPNRSHAPSHRSTFTPSAPHSLPSPVQRCYTHNLTLRSLLLLILIAIFAVIIATAHSCKRIHGENAMAQPSIPEGLRYYPLADSVVILPDTATAEHILDSLMRTVEAYRDLGQSVRALNQYSQILPLLRQLADTASTLQAYWDISALFAYLQAPALGATYLSQAIPLLKWQSVHDTLWNAYIIANIGIYYREANYPDSSLLYTDWLYQLSDSMRKGYPTLLCGLDRARMHMDEGHYNVALSILNECERIVDTIGREHYCLPLRLIQCECLIRANYNDSVPKLIQQIRNMLHLASFPTDYLDYLNICTDFYLMQNNFSMARTYIDSAYYHARRIGHANYLLQALKKLEQLQRILGNNDSVYHVVWEQILLNDSVYKNLASMDFLLSDQQTYEDLVTLEQKASIARSDFDQMLENRNFRLFITFAALSGLMLLILVAILVRRFITVYKRQARQREREKELTLLHNDLTRVITDITDTQRLNIPRSEELMATQRSLQNHSKLLMDSLEYASTLQRAVQPDLNKILNGHADHFLISRASEVVSADLVFAEKTNGRFYFALIDCCYPGVAGASLSFMVYIQLKNLIVEKRISNPQAIIRHFYQSMCRMLDPTASRISEGMRMDSGMLVLDPEAGTAEFTSVDVPLFLEKKDGTIITLTDTEALPGEPIMRPTGPIIRSERFEMNEYNAFFLVTDGVFEQKNAEGNPLGSKGLQNILAKSHGMTMKERRWYLLNQLSSYRRGVEQANDVTILGLGNIIKI